MDFDVVDCDEFSMLERNSVVGSSFASVFPRGSLIGEDFAEPYKPIEEEKDEEQKTLDIDKFIEFMRQMTQHEKMTTENFLKCIYAKNEVEFEKYM